MNAKFDNIIISVMIFILIFLIIWLIKNKESGPYIMDSQNKSDNFNKLLDVYKDIIKLIIGIASGSIVLIVSNKLEKLPIEFITPLYLLLFSIIYGIFFIVFLTLNYESYKHDSKSYTKFKYTRNIALGYSSLMCFIFGYFWLILRIT